MIKLTQVEFVKKYNRARVALLRIERGGIFLGGIQEGKYVVVKVSLGRLLSTGGVSLASEELYEVSTIDRVVGIISGVVADSESKILEAFNLEGYTDGQR